MKKYYTILFMSFTMFLTFSQEAKPVQATTGTSITRLLFDKTNNQYMCGAVCGRVWVKGVYNDKYASGYQQIMGKLTDDLKFEWLVELDERPWDARLIDDKIYLIYRKIEKFDKKITSTILMEVYDLNGKKITSKDMFKFNGSNYGVHTTSSILDNGIFTWTTLKGDDSMLEIDGKKFTKKSYSLVYFRMIDFDGNTLWDYQIEGGTDGFTDLRIQNVAKDDKGNLYVVSYYAHSADLGIAKFETKEMFPDIKAQKLYYNGVFMMKFNKDGKPLRAEVLAENSLTVESILIDNEGNLYISGYHTGNDTYAMKQDDGRPYIGAKIRGQAFEYSDKMSQDSPSDDAFIAKLDSSWNLLWKQNFYGSGYNRIINIKQIGKDNYAVVGMFSGREIYIEGKKYDEHPDNKNYTEAFYFQINASGEISNLQLIIGSESNLAHLFLDSNSKPVITTAVATKTITNINGKEYKGYGHWGGTFIYRP